MKISDYKQSIERVRFPDSYQSDLKKVLLETVSRKAPSTVTIVLYFLALISFLSLGVSLTRRQA